VGTHVEYDSRILHHRFWQLLIIKVLVWYPLYCDFWSAGQSVCRVCLNGATAASQEAERATTTD